MWSCSFCTFDNDPLVGSCVMCLGAREESKCELVAHGSNEISPTAFQDLPLQQQSIDRSTEFHVSDSRGEDELVLPMPPHRVREDNLMPAKRLSPSMSSSVFDTIRAVDGQFELEQQQMQQHPSASSSTSTSAATIQQHYQPKQQSHTMSLSTSTSTMLTHQYQPEQQPRKTSSSTSTFATTQTSQTVIKADETITGAPVFTIKYVMPPAYPPFPKTHAAMTKPDLRFMLCCQLSREVPTLLSSTHNKLAVYPLLHALYSLSLSRFPVRSLKALKHSTQIKGFNDEIYNRLKKLDGKYSHSPTDQGWATVFEAVLQCLKSGPTGSETLLASVLGKMYGTGQFNRWLTSDVLKVYLKVMQNAQVRCGFDSPLIKSSKRGDMYTFSLTAAGDELCDMLCARGAGPASPGPLRALPMYPGADERFVHTTIGVDCQEGGNEHHESMCRYLDSKYLPYFSCGFECGDYLFFHAGKILPVVIERKSIADMAMSMWDGRWKSQKAKMMRAAHTWGWDKSVLIYLIEGKLLASVLKDRWVGDQRYQVDVEKFKEQIDALSVEGFQVLYSSSKNESINTVVEVSKIITKSGVSGEFSYQQFVSKVRAYADTNFGLIGADVLGGGQQETDNNNGLIDLCNSDDDETGEPAMTAGTDRNLSLIRTLKEFIRENRLRLYDKLYSEEEGKRQGTWGSGQLVAPPVPKKLKVECGAVGGEGIVGSGLNTAPDDDLDHLPIAELKQRCSNAHKSVGGKKADMIARLRAPPLKPSILARKKANLWVPSKVDSGNVAILVCLLLHDPDNKGLTKEVLWRLSDESNIKETTFTGGTTQNSPYIYDGWAGMEKYLKNGEVPLIIQSKGKYRLSTLDPVKGGLVVARDYHDLLHDMGKCTCGRLQP